MALERVGMKAVFEGGQQYISQLHEAERAQKGLTDSIGKTSGASSSLLKSIMGTAGGFALYHAAVRGIETSFKVGIKSAIDFESSFAGVRKTVNASEAEFKQLEGAFRDMAKQIPINVNEINRIGESAGQLGIAKNNIVDFTEVIAKLGVTTNLTSEDAASSLARLANITQMNQEDFDRLGSTIVALGNNFATTEREIVAMSLRIAGAGAQIGLTESEITAFATALSSVGIEAEAGGSAISKVFVEIANQVRSGGDNLETFAAVAGMSIDQFSTLFEKDAASALQAFIKGLDRVSKSGGNVFAVLEELGFTEVRTRDALLRTANAGDLLARALDLSNEAWEENNALTKEAEQRFSTTESKIQIAKNNINDLGISIGQTLLPVLGDMALGLTRAIEAARNNQGLRDFAAIVVNVVQIVSRAIGDLVSVFSGSFGRIQSIVEGTTGNIRKALEEISPWTRHSPSLVEQVETGVDAIVDAYDGLDAIEDDIDTAAAAIEVLEDAQRDLTDTLDEARGTLDKYGEELADAKAEYERFASAMLAEELPFNEQAADLEQQMKELELQIVRLKQQGPLEVEVQTVKKDKTGKIVRDDSGKPVMETDTVKTAIGKQVEALEAQLDSLRLKAREVDLSKELAIDPLKEEIDALKETSETMTFEEIVEGLKTSREKVDELTGVHEEWQGKVEELEADYKALQKQITIAKDAAQDARDAAKAAKDAEAADSGVLGEIPGAGEGGDPMADTSPETIANIEAAKQEAILATAAAADEAGRAYVESSAKQAEAASFWGDVGVKLAPFTGPIWDRLKASMGKFGDWVRGTFAQRLGGVFEAVSEAWTDITTFIDDHQREIQLIIEGSLDLIFGIFERIFKQIGLIVEGTLLALSGIINAVFGILTGDWDRAWKGILQILEAVKILLWDSFRNALDGLADLVRNLWPIIEGLFILGLGVLLTAIEGLGNSIIGAVQGIWNKIKEWAGTVWEIGKDLGGQLMDGMLNGITAAGRTVGNVFIAMLNKFIDMVNAIKIPEINVPDWVPFIGGKSWGGWSPNIPNIPQLAEGGIVDSPTLAMIGERGRQEAVTPIDTFRDAVSALRGIEERIAQSMRADGSRAMSGRTARGGVDIFNSPLALVPSIPASAAGGTSVVFGPNSLVVEYAGPPERAAQVGTDFGQSLTTYLRGQGVRF